MIAQIREGFKAKFPETGESMALIKDPEPEIMGQE